MEAQGSSHSLALASRLGQGASFQLFARITMVAANYVIHVALARTLGPARYGTIGAVLSVLTIQRMVVVNVTRQIVSKFVSESTYAICRIKRWSLVVQSVFTFALALVCFGLAGPLARWLGDPALKLYLRVSVPFVPLVGWYAIQLAALNGSQRFAEQAVTIMVYNIVRVGGTLGYVYLLPGLGREMGAILGFITAPLVALLFAGSFGPWRRPVSRLQGEASAVIARGETARFALDILLSALGLTLLLNLGQLLVKAFGSDPSEAGHYTAANAVGIMSYTMLLAFSDVIIPVAIRANDLPEGNGAVDIIVRTWEYMLWCAFLVLALVGSTAAALITWIYGSDYMAAAPLVFWCCVALSLLAMFVMLSNAVAAVYSSHLVLLCTTGALSGTVLLGVAGTTLAGASGFLYAMTASLVAALAVYAWYLRKMGGVLHLSRLGWPILGAIAIAVSAALVRPRGGMLIPVYGVFSAGYLAFLWSVGTIQPQEKQALALFVGNTLSRFGRGNDR
jgi:O-antigen/teichoic acid export membrane protein